MGGFVIYSSHGRKISLSSPPDRFLPSPFRPPRPSPVVRDLRQRPMATIIRDARSWFPSWMLDYMELCLRSMEYLTEWISGSAPKPTLMSSERFTLTSDGVLLLAQCKRLPDISRSWIKNQAKGSTLSKGLACV